MGDATLVLVEDLEHELAERVVGEPNSPLGPREDSNASQASDGLVDVDLAVVVEHAQLVVTKLDAEHGDAQDQLTDRLGGAREPGTEHVVDVEATVGVVAQGPACSPDAVVDAPG